MSPWSRLLAGRRECPVRLSACTPTLIATAGPFDGPWAEKSMRAANLSNFSLTGPEEGLWAQPDLDSTPALWVT